VGGQGGATWEDGLAWMQSTRNPTGEVMRGAKAWFSFEHVYVMTLSREHLRKHYVNAGTFRLGPQHFPEFEVRKCLGWCCVALHDLLTI
jgi:hypothetical protein